MAKACLVNEDDAMNKPDPPSGLVRVTAASHPSAVGDPAANVQATLSALAEHADSNVVVFGELSLCGYTCGDLLAQDTLLAAVVSGLEHLCATTGKSEQMVVVGCPLRVGSRLYNVAAVLFQGRILGLVPKQFLPNYQEFYEARWFAAANGSEPEQVNLGESLGTVPFGIDLLFQAGPLKVGVELCEDLWMPIPPSSSQAAAGANLLLNLSASNELIGKAAWREVLVRSQSGRCLASYAYASAGPTESTTDVVFGGQCLVAENGYLLAQSQRVGQRGCAWIEHTSATADIDLCKLDHDRQVTVSWQQATQRETRKYRTIQVASELTCDGRLRQVSATPFVPSAGPELHERCAEIFGIQCAALTKRVRRLPDETSLHIGVSGGLDSTLALLVAVKTYLHQGWPVTRIHGLTMPGFGTSKRSLSAARTLMQHLGITTEEIDIRPLCQHTFAGLGHHPFGIDISDLTIDQLTSRLREIPIDQQQDLVFENVQARIRTMLLMSRGFVLGTGDLSEQALGWSTYNGDHMSMYNVNTSVPKTLVRFLVRYVADHQFEGLARNCLHDIADTPISPELLPTDAEGNAHQSTESTIGDYELHDFFLYHLIRFGTTPKRILQLAGLAQFSRPYSPTEIRNTLRIFLSRFFANQFKRSCVPDGPKVGSVSLSPRGDWRMPSDAEVDAWLRDLEA